MNDFILVTEADMSLLSLLRARAPSRPQPERVQNSPLPRAP